MADYDNLVQDQLVETTAHINGWQAIRRLLIGGNRLASLSDGAELGPVIGTYTGDGAASKAVTGIGFQPRMVMIFGHTDGAAYTHIKTSSDGTKTTRIFSDYEDDLIISLDSNGFTVGDGTGTSGGNTLNVNTTIYTYIAWR